MLVLISSFLLFLPFKAYATPQKQSCLPAGKKTVAYIVKQLGSSAEARVKPYFEKAGVAYPAHHLAFVVLKEEMALEVWAEQAGKWVPIRTYDFLGSGEEGPKQRKGDRQVPEGIYQITELNPSSRFHLSMKLNYPNEFDLKKAREDRRSDLGGDIFIHGNVKSCGCLAVGDRAIEELFLLAAKTGANNIKVIIAPRDMRKNSPPPFSPEKPSWLSELYDNIGQELAKFRLKQGV